ncbi:MAG: SRPBCC domain-containing protein [Reichenbachiella sp.]
MEHIKHLFYINAESKIVYNALTTQTGLAGWWTTEVEAQAKKGFLIKFHFGDEFHPKMRIELLIPNKEIHWTCEDGESEWISTKIKFILEKKDNRTLLHFSHENWAAQTEFYASCNFNWAFYLTSLKNLCEKGKGLPFPLSVEG